jgi:O-antigen ligase
MIASQTRVPTITLGLLACLLAGIGVVYLPPFWFTLVLGLLAMLLVMARPREGLFLVLLLLYYPLLPNVPLGPLEFSATSPLTLGLFLGTLNLQRRDVSLYLARWQAVLLAALGLVFLFTMLFSDSLADSLPMAPNLVVYWMLLYVCMLLVRRVEQLWAFARLILVLGFILSIWRVELRPLRLVLGLPSLGINGAVFAFHPAVALAMIMAILLPKQAVSSAWRLFSWVALTSFLYHGILYQTRAGWLVLIVMAAIFGLQAHGWARVVFALGVVTLLFASATFFADPIRANMAQTRSTVEAALGETSYASATSDDLIRLVSHQAGLRMFYARPAFGWGPGAYFRLKLNFVNYLGKEAYVAGAFDSWLITLVDMGIAGTIVVLCIFLLPLPLTWLALQKARTPTTMLAFAFALGVLGLSVHLLFIDLLYSFAWMHAGLALAAGRLASEPQCG